MYYKMDTSFSPENVKKFCEAYLAGSLVGKEVEVRADEMRHTGGHQMDDVDCMHIFLLLI